MAPCGVSAWEKSPVFSAAVGPEANGETSVLVTEPFGRLAARFRAQSKAPPSHTWRGLGPILACARGTGRVRHAAFFVRPEPPGDGNRGGLPGGFSTGHTIDK